jgi:hypothetical protein
LHGNIERVGKGDAGADEVGGGGLSGVVDGEKFEDSCGFRDRERIEEQRVGEGEDRGVGADSERERKQGGCGERRSWRRVRKA